MTSDASNTNDDNDEEEEEELVHEIDTDDDVAIMKKSQDRNSIDGEIVAAVIEPGGLHMQHDDLGKGTGSGNL